MGTQAAVVTLERGSPDEVHLEQDSRGLCRCEQGVQGLGAPVVAERSPCRVLTVRDLTAFDGRASGRHGPQFHGQQRTVVRWECTNVVGSER